MNRQLSRLKILFIFVLTVGSWLITLPGQTSGIAQAVAISQQPATEIKVQLGSETGELKFIPNDIKFRSGKRYKLVLSNPSTSKHYFTAKDFADGIWTQKVDAGNVEVKGAIKELELRPSTTADWVFVPMKPGTYNLRCTIPGHTEAGMTGTLTIMS
jgi:uncharacterized cupredoxin-like copper-binding protein